MVTVSAFPLFPGVPGGLELLIVLLAMVLVLGVPTLLVAAAAYFGLRYARGGDTREERIEELEREVRELRERVGADDAADGRVTARSPPEGDDAGADADADDAGTR